MCQGPQSDFAGKTNFSQDCVGGLADHISCSDLKGEVPDFVSFLLEIHYQLHVSVFFPGVALSDSAFPWHADNDIYNNNNYYYVSVRLLIRKY